MVDGLPTSLAELVEALAQRGFTVAADHREPARESRSMELVNRSRETASAVRIEQDRGLWSAEVDVAGKWRGCYEIVLALDGGHYASRALSHQERLQYTIEAVDRMPPASEIQPLLDRLDDFDREYWKRLGVERSP